MLKVALLGICLFHIGTYDYRVILSNAGVLLCVFACGRSVFRKRLSKGTWHRTHTRPRSQPET